MLKSGVEIQLDLGENWYDPGEFVEAVMLAEELGFRTAWLGDHFVPWFHSGARAQFVWSTLGVAMAKTSTIKSGPLVTSSIGGRYHPAIIAQASATLDNMFPGRFLLGVGTGEAINEVAFMNDRWPNWTERIERLVEGVQLMRRLWESKEPFSWNGKFFSASFYYLYTKPKTKIPIYFAAAGRKAACYAGKFGDKMVTLAPKNSPEKLRAEIIPSYMDCAKESGRAGGTAARIDFSFKSPERLIAEEWQSLGILAQDSFSLRTPVDVELAGRTLSAEELSRKIHFVEDWRSLINMINKYIDIGIKEIIIPTDANKDFIRETAKNLLTIF